MARSSCVALLLAAALVACDAFVSPQARWVPASMGARRSDQRPVVALKTTPHLLPSISTTARRAAASDDDATAAEPATPPAVPEDLDYYDGLLGQQPGADKAAAASQGDGSASTTDYPIPLPSYLLLALATVLSIAFTGSIFEVTGGHPELGYPATYVIGTLSLPSFIFLFYAAIKKGQAEVEEDDAKFKQGRW